MPPSRPIHFMGPPCVKRSCKPSEGRRASSHRPRIKKGPAGPTRQPVKARAQTRTKSRSSARRPPWRPHAEIETTPASGGANEAAHLGTEQHPEGPGIEAGHEEDTEYPDGGGPVGLPARVKPLMAESAIIHALGLSNCSMAPDGPGSAAGCPRPGRWRSPPSRPARAGRPSR